MIQLGNLMRQTQRQNTIAVRQEVKIANEHTNSNEYIVQAVVEVARGAIQTVSAASAARKENTGSRMSGPFMKQPKFIWSFKDKHSELRNFKLEVKTCSKSLI